MNTEPATATPKRTLKKRSRADVYRNRVQIRLALDSCGPAIAEILKENGIEFPGADFSRVFPHWLIATVEDEVIGCIMVMPGKPIGFLECLFVKPGVSFKLRAIALRKLAFQGAATLLLAGGYYACCTVDESNKKFYDVLLKHNVIHAGSAALMIKRLK